MPQVDLVVTDLDGTLWFGHEETHPATVAAWQELERRKIPILVATGRRVTSTRTPLARLGFAPPAVMMNGALVMHLETGERYHRHLYSAEAARQVLAAFRAAEVEPCVYVDHAHIDVFVGEQPSTHPEHLRGLGATAAQGDLDEIVGSLPVLMFGIMGNDAGPLLDVARGLLGAAETHLAESDQYGGHSFTVTPLGLSKWIGVVAYCERHDLDPGRVLAIGDGPNDCELLDAAAVAVVPRDGCAEALDLADHVVASPRDGGWAELLDLV
jgi:hydroxymethylpyrimidine pyrophosphatase-like HAD family hydrolase